MTKNQFELAQVGQSGADCPLIDYATFNVWWITINETSYTYNLQLIGSPRVFTVTFDLTKEVEAPSAPWGWKD